MRKQLLIISTILLTILSAGCDDTMKDDELPVIDMSADWAFPVNCATVYRGESFAFRAEFRDNVALGSYSIELHHNFNHHTHSTDATQCEMDPVKQAVRPFLHLEEYDIPAGSSMYEAQVTVSIPTDVDTGDYHFMVRLTDEAGWQTFKGISIKIADRE